MPQPDLPDAPVPDGDASTRADLRRAAKWAITGAVTSALMCASGVLAGERLSEQAVNPALLEEDLSEVVGRMAAACAVGGLLPGVVVAFLSGGGLRVGRMGVGMGRAGLEPVGAYDLRP